jgi:hypothetical protein
MDYWEQIQINREMEKTFIYYWKECVVKNKRNVNLEDINFLAGLIKFPRSGNTMEHYKNDLKDMNRIYQRLVSKHEKNN